MATRSIGWRHYLRHFSYAAHSILSQKLGWEKNTRVTQFATKNFLFLDCYCFLFFSKYSRLNNWTNTKLQYIPFFTRSKKIETIINAFLVCFSLSAVACRRAYFALYKRKEEEKDDTEKGARFNATSRNRVAFLKWHTIRINSCQKHARYRNY